MFSGLAFGFSQAVITGIWAMSFYFGATLVVKGQTTFNAVMRSIAAILLSGIIIGQSTQLAPDIGKARIAAAAIFRLLDRVPPIDSSSGAGRAVDHVDGRLDADSLEFAYPARPNQQILRGLSFHLPARRSLAIVGPSGMQSGAHAVSARGSNRVQRVDHDRAPARPPARPNRSFLRSRPPRSIVRSC